MASGLIEANFITHFCPKNTSKLLALMRWLVVPHRDFEIFRCDPERKEEAAVRGAAVDVESGARSRPLLRAARKPRSAIVPWALALRPCWVVYGLRYRVHVRRRRNHTEPLVALESTVTSKGHTTLRKDVREHLGLETGDKVRHLIIGDEVRLVRPRKVMSVCGSLPHEGDPVSLDEMNEAVRAGAAARQRRDR